MPAEPAISRIHGFPPVWRADAQTLVLGSMPGVASLHAQRYYAHPRNQFWPLLGGLLGFDPTQDYATRLRSLLDAGIALWDVLGSCERPGSLDSAIHPNSVRVNDLPGLAAGLPGLRRILFNGRTAHALFKRHVPWSRSDVRLLPLPSTSPAHAGLSLEAKRVAWGAALRAPEPPAG